VREAWGIGRRDRIAVCIARADHSGPRALEIRSAWLAIGKSGSGRTIFLVFTIRQQGGQRLIRPISARYMHAQEIAWYEREDPEL
jgi:uncharacterized DUF497 family protein